jgi:hypothetical protein
MSATFILTTQDPALAAEWARQLPSPPLSLAGGDALLRELQRPGARVWIRDICDGDAQSPAHPDTVIILVGEPRSLPFEESKHSRANAYCLSYDESRSELRRIAPMAAELAQSRAVLSILQDRPRKADQPAAAVDAPEPARRNLDDFEFLAGAIEHLDDRTRIIDEFRRGVRARIRSSRVVVFLRDDKRYVAEGESWECSAGHDLVRWLQEHAAIVDSATLDSVESASIEASIRQKLGEWNSRLLVPLEVHGALEGWVVFGPRADGRPYSASDRDDSLMLVRLLSRMIGQHKMLRSAQAAQRETGLMQKFGPKFCIIGVSGKTDESLPVEVREISALALRDGKRVEREFGRMRVAAGPIPGAGCWVWWDESSFTAESSAQKREAERHQILHDLGIMISHELANAMFSVSTYFQHLRRQRSADDSAHPLMERVGQDMERMKAMPHLLSTLYEMSKQPTGRVDMKRVVQSVAHDIGGLANTPESGPIIWGHEKNLQDALLWLCREILDTKDKVAPISRDSKITLSLQQRRRDDDSICLVTISYPGLRVDQIKVGEATSTEEYPTVPVYLAREVIRFHYGTVHVGQGLDGPELMIALKSRRVNAIAEVDPLLRKLPEAGAATPFGAPGPAAPGNSDAFPASA